MPHPLWKGAFDIGQNNVILIILKWNADSKAKYYYYGLFDTIK